MDDILARFGEEREKEQVKSKNYWQYILYASAFCVIAFASSGMVNAFNEAFFLASTAFANAFILAPLFGISALSYLSEFPRFISSLALALVVTVTVEACKRLKCKHTKLISLLVATAVKIGFAVFSPTLLKSLINALILPLATFPLYIALGGVYKKPRLYRQGDLELGCTLILVCFLSSAVASAKLYTVYGFFAFTTLCVFAVYGRGEGVFTAISVGVGITMKTLSVEGVALCAFVGALTSLFVSAPRPLTVLSMLMATVIFKLYFATDYSSAVYLLIATTVGGVAFCIIPKNWLEKLKEVLLRPSDKSALAYLVLSERNCLAKELNKVGAVFGEMSRALVIDRPQLNSLENSASAIERNVCANCNKCSGNRTEALLSLLKISEQKGRATVTDAPYFLDNDCPRVAHLISLTAEYASERKKKCRKLQEEEKIREELAQSFDGVRQILKKKSALLSKLPSQEFNKERLLVEELRANGIVVIEALISGDEMTLVVAEGVDECALLNEIRAITGTPYTITSTQHGGAFTVLTLVERTPFDAFFAVSSRSKSVLATGDTHAFIRIDNGKFLMALCDGMGSGESAGRISESAVGLVESFYKAGFSSEFVIENVNRFLSFSASESFAAFDILICDLYTLDRTVIKLGSPASFIRSGEGVSQISGSSLPLGALVEIKPSVYVDKASEGDTVVFMSDGVSEIFSGNELAMLISGANEKSVQKMTDTILEHALARKKGVISDDMTVIAVRVIKRI